MLELPKVYEIKADTPEEYHRYAGMPKLSYSQYTSWKEPAYKNDYIRQYFLGEKQEPNVFAQFGSACGQYLENLTVDREWLSDVDVSTLSLIERPENAIYEGEIVIDRGDYVIQGFIDQEYMLDGKLVIRDLKTGNVDNKVAFYGGEHYQQTTLYSYARMLEGFEIGYSGVILLGRRGMGTRQWRLKLSGVIKEIPTPFSVERATKALAHIDAAAHEISNAYKLFKKLNGYDKKS